jgi:hypothetical protein
MAGTCGITAVTPAANLAAAHSPAALNPAAINIAAAAHNQNGVETNHGITAILPLIACVTKLVVVDT